MVFIIQVIFFNHRYTFNIPEGQPTIIKAVVYVPGHFEQSTYVRLFNNDGPAPGTSKEAPQAFFYLKPQLCYPSKNGYTLLADFKSPVPKLATKWKLRVFSDIAFMFLSPEKPLEGLSIKPIVQDFEDVYVPTKHNIIFRYIIRVKDASENNVSMQLSFNIPYVSLRLQLFDYDNEIFSEYGKGVITIHSVNFYSNQPDGDVAQVTTGKASKDQAKQAANTALVYIFNISQNTSTFCKQVWSRWN